MKNRKPTRKTISVKNIKSSKLRPLNKKNDGVLFFKGFTGSDEEFVCPPQKTVAIKTVARKRPSFYYQKVKPVAEIEELNCSICSRSFLLEVNKAPRVGKGLF